MDHDSLLNNFVPFAEQKQKVKTQQPLTQRSLLWNEGTNFSTVELGYNDHGYYELTVITNKIRHLVWFSIFLPLKFHAYIEQKVLNSRL